MNKTYLTTEELLVIGWSIADNWWESGWHVNAVRDFKRLMESLSANPPSPNDVIIQFYDYYKSHNYDGDQRFAEVIRDRLFAILNIEPNTRNCFIRLFSDEKYTSASLKDRTKQLDDIVYQMKYPIPENTLRSARL